MEARSAPTDAAEDGGGGNSRPRRQLLTISSPKNVPNASTLCNGFDSGAFGPAFALPLLSPLPIICKLGQLLAAAAELDATATAAAAAAAAAAIATALWDDDAPALGIGVVEADVRTGVDGDDTIDNG